MTLAQRVLTALRRGPATNHEIAARLGAPYLSVASTCSYLSDVGLIVAVDRQPVKRGRCRTVWSAIPQHALDTPPLLPGAAVWTPSGRAAVVLHIDQDSGIVTVRYADDDDDPGVELPMHLLRRRRCDMRPFTPTADGITAAK